MTAGPGTTIRRGQGPDRNRYRSAEEFRASGSAIARPRTHPPRPPTSTFRALTPRAPGFRRRVVAVTVMPPALLRDASRTAQRKPEQPAVRFNDRLKPPNGQARPDPSRSKTSHSVRRVESGRFNRPVPYFLSDASQPRVIILPQAMNQVTNSDPESQRNRLASVLRRLVASTDPQTQHSPSI